MERTATQSNGSKKQNHGQSFQPVFDSRKRKIPGLWRRGNRYYAQLRVDLGNGQTAPRRLPLNAINLDEAKGELERKRTERRDGKLPRTGFRPKFEDFASEYLASSILTQKKDRTQTSERQAIKRWIRHLGGVPLDKISVPIIHSFREKRLRKGTSPRTVNLDTIALRNVLKYARDRELIERLPEVRQLKVSPPPRRELLRKEQIIALVEEATNPKLKNGPLFRFYLRFLLMTGAREQETLFIRWADVDFQRQTVTIGKNGVSKNGRERDVDFSPQLAALLDQMAAQRPPDTSWLFPSPQRGVKDEHAKTLRETLKVIRTKVGLPNVGFHDLRHYFASGCVMAGLDYMTIASWLGHSDGGILVGKVYGHLAETHKKAAAQKLKFLEDAPA